MRILLFEDHYADQLAPLALLQRLKVEPLQVLALRPMLKVPH